MSRLKNINAMFLIILALLASGKLSAESNIHCDSNHYATDSIDVIAHAEPDLPPVILPQEQKKKAKSSPSFFSWLTKSHTMPSLHFIGFIELFGDEES